MHRPALISIALLTTFLLAACSGGGGATTAPQASTGTSAAPVSEAPAAEACSPSNETGTVKVEIANFAFTPAEASATVGDTVTWTNADAAAHTATLDDGACATGNIPSDGSGSLVFNAAGTFKYHCAIHPTMTGTITVSE
jgi:plastocyanin